MLLTLPPELLLEVIGHATADSSAPYASERARQRAKRTASCLRLTNRELSVSARPYIYKSISAITTKRAREFSRRIHREPQLARYVEHLVVGVSFTSPPSSYTAAENAKDIVVFDADVEAIGYTPMHSRTRAEIRERIELMAIPNLMHKLPRLVTLEVYFGEVTPVLDAYIQNTDLWKSHTLPSLKNLIFAPFLDTRILTVVFDKVLPILNASAGTLEVFTGVSCLGCELGAGFTIHFSQLKTLGKLVDIEMSRSSVQGTWWMGFLEKTPRLKRFSYTGTPIPITRKDYTKALRRVHQTLEVLELREEFDEYRFDNIEMEHTVGSLREFLRLKKVCIEFGMLVGSNLDGGPDRSLKDSLPNSLVKLSLSNYEHPTVPFIYELYELVRTKRNGLMPKLREIENCEPTRAIFDVESIMVNAMRLRGVCRKFGVKLAGADFYDYNVSEYTDPGMPRDFGSDVHRLIDVWNDMDETVLESDDWPSEAFDSQDEASSDENEADDVLDGDCIFM